MKKIFVLSFVILLMCGLSLSAQDTLFNKKSLSFPTKKYGISIGNSYEFTGLRINIADENVKVINGLNVTFWLKFNENKNAVVNGISIGVIPTAGTMGPIGFGILGIGANNNLYGLTLGGFVIGAGGNIKGLTVSGLLTVADGENSVISGIAISGIAISAREAIKGLAIGGIGVVTDGDINGIAVTCGYMESEMFKGIAIAGYTNTTKMFGLSFALFNRTKELHGVQFGLINYAENNPKGLKILPFINLHF